MNRKDAQERLEKIRGFYKAAHKAILYAQEKMRVQANKKQRLPNFDVGDRVFIVKKAWSTIRPSDKLDFPMTRNYFLITKKVKENAFELELPASWKGSKKFNAKRLCKFDNNPLLGQAVLNPEVEEVDGEEEFEVEEVLASRIYYGKL